MEKSYRTDVVVEQPGIGWFRAACTLTMTAVGLGVLALPGTATHSGWLGSLFGLLVASSIILYNNHLLWRALRLAAKEEEEVAKCYEEVGRVAFGKIAAVYFGATLHVTLIAVCSVMLLLLASTCEAMALVLDRRAWVAIWIVVGIPLSWIKEVKNVGFIATIGVVTVSAMVIVIFVASADKLVQDGVARDLKVGPDGAIDFFSMFATYFFGYGMSSTTPTVCANMTRPMDFPKALFVALVFCTALYMAVMELGYIAYGQALAGADTIAGAISPAGQRLNTFGWIINVVVLVVVSSHYLVLFTPTAKKVDELCLDISEKKQWSSFKYKLVSLLGRTGLVILEGCIAIVVPKVDALVSLIGAFCVPHLSIFFPIACYVKMRRSHQLSIPKWELVLFAALIVIGFVVMVLGIYGAIIQF